MSLAKYLTRKGRAIEKVQWCQHDMPEPKFLSNNSSKIARYHLSPHNTLSASQIVEQQTAIERNEANIPVRSVSGSRQNNRVHQRDDQRETTLSAPTMLKATRHIRHQASTFSKMPPIIGDRQFKRNGRRNRKSISVGKTGKMAKATSSFAMPGKAFSPRSAKGNDE